MSSRMVKRDAAAGGGKGSALGRLLGIGAARRVVSAEGRETTPPCIACCMTSEYRRRD